MKKSVVFAGVALIAASVMADGPMIKQDTHELSLAGNLNRDTLALGIGYGYFIMDGLEVGAGVVGSYNDFGDKSDAKTFGGDLFAQYNFDLESKFVPFVGVAAGVRYTKLDISGYDSDSETGVFGEGQLGVKYFIVDNLAITLFAFYDISDKEVYTNKDKMEKDDFGLRLGMNTYF